jgi:hypothetical protein
MTRAHEHRSDVGAWVDRHERLHVARERRPTQPVRDRQLRVLVNDDELAMLHALADDRGVSVSDVVREGVRERYFEMFGSKPVKPCP